MLNHKTDSFTDQLTNAEEVYLPSVSVDCVIFGFHAGQFKVLLLKWKHNKKWALPGGFIYKDEDVENAAIRVLNERTQLKDIFLQQFSTPYVTIYRDLHCWEMSFNWVPTGLYRGFKFELRIKAPQLQDIKVTKQTNYRGVF